MRALVFSLMCFATAAFAYPTFENANYTGSGHWVGCNGAKGDFSLTLTTTGRQFESSYQFNNNGKLETMSIKGHVVPGENGFFKVELDDPKGEAKGYCESTGKWCHYGMKTADGWMEASFYVQGDNIFEIGSKKLKGGMVVHWESKLSKATAR